MNTEFLKYDSVGWWVFVACCGAFDLIVWLITVPGSVLWILARLLVGGTS